MARYGKDHQALRKAWAPKVEAGGVICWRCHKPIQPGTPWDLGHGDGAEREQHKGPEHRGKCNRATATHMAARRQRPTPPHPGRIGD
jgi:hypothetical protein